MERTVLHCDCNSFFASVEITRDPRLADVPMAVAGSEDDRHGIILAKNEIAKRYGIVTAETVRDAKRKCPSLVLVAPHYEEYVKYSSAVREIYARYTDMIEPFGLDEAWLDVTGSRALFGDGLAIADRIRREIKAELGITVSVGVSFNKVFAKLGSDYKKPDAVTVIGREDVARIVYPLPVDAILFVGRKTAAALIACNIKTIGDLAAVDPAFLIRKFGKAGEMLSDYARGKDESPVAVLGEKADAKSVSNGMTFRHDLVREDELRAALELLSEDVAYRLRKHGMKCTTVGITVKDPFLKSYTRQIPVSATQLSREIAAAAFALLLKNARGKPVRMLTVSAMNLVHEEDAAEQIGFFDEERHERREKNQRLETTMDAIRSRFGRAALRTGATVDNDWAGGSRKEAEDGYDDE